MPKTPPTPNDGRQKYHDGIPVLVRSLAGRSTAGLTDQEIADHLGVARKTVQRWKKDHPEFLAALIETKAVFDARVEMSLFRRATGYQITKIEVTTEGGQEVKRVTKTEEIPPDTNACRLWLTNRRPDLWRDVSEQKLSGEIGLADVRIYVPDNGRND